MSLSMRQVARIAAGAGFTRRSAPMAVAIAMAESSLDPGAVGDVSLVDAKWGPSYGLWQIRSLKAESGRGSTRDGTRLKNAEFNARSAFTISQSGWNWSPWSTFKNGAYRKHLPAATKAVEAQLGPDPLAGTDLGYTPPEGQKIPAAPKVGQRNGGQGGGVTPVGIDLPGPDAIYGLGGLGLGLLGNGGDLLDGLTGDATAGLRAAALEALIWTAALGLGISLVLIGTWGTVRAGTKQALT